jgi:hypothetical protein
MSNSCVHRIDVERVLAPRNGVSPERSLSSHLLRVVRCVVTRADFATRGRAITKALESPLMVDTARSSRACL